MKFLLQYLILTIPRLHRLNLGDLLDGREALLTDQQVLQESYKLVLKKKDVLFKRLQREHSSQSCEHILLHADGHD